MHAQTSIQVDYMWGKNNVSDDGYISNDRSFTDIFAFVVMPGVTSITRSHAKTAAPARTFGIGVPNVLVTLKIYRNTTLIKTLEQKTDSNGLAEFPDQLYDVAAWGYPTIRFVFSAPGLEEVVYSFTSGV